MNQETYRRLSRDYRDYLEILGFVSTTVHQRYRELLRFLHWLEVQQIGDLKEVTIHHLEQYKIHLGEQPNQNTGGKLHPKTIYDRMRVIELLFMMLQSKGMITINPFSTFQNDYKESNAERTILTQSEIKSLYEATENYQEKAMLSLAYGCGLRAAELEAVDVQDIKLRDGILIVPKGKGNKRRTIPLSPGVKEDLKDYFYQERSKLIADPEEVAFMLHSQGGRMRGYTWNKYLKRIIERTEDITIQSKQISLHNLRHSIATHLLENGIAVEQVRLFLGHSMVETTETYTRVNQEQLKKLSE